MQHRRIYASLDGNLRARETVNGAVMGSTLARPGTFRFDFAIEDPDRDDPRSRVTRIEVIKDGGAVAASFVPPTLLSSRRWRRCCATSKLITSSSGCGTLAAATREMTIRLLLTTPLALATATAASAANQPDHAWVQMVSGGAEVCTMVGPAARAGWSLLARWTRGS